MSILHKIPLGEKPPEIVNIVIECVSGSRDKYEYNKEWDELVLDRIIPSSVVFPVEYGFIPQTWCNDEDPLDALVLSYEPLEVGCIVKARVIGALIIEDEKGEDPKILCVPLSDARFDGIKDIKDVHPHKLKEIQEFFETYKRLEPHKFSRFKEWKNSKEAKEIVVYSHELYKKKFQKIKA
ncbi:MAG: inorganic diphosphatase [Candidatus Aenigmarchaeota archaeon]|nr:inorganic diphosphatase [Candidatus Aenigmarchaeota archaeon]